jgi:hypothetical protein
MKSALLLTAISLPAAAVQGSVIESKPRAADGYVQNPSGTALHPLRIPQAVPSPVSNAIRTSQERTRREYSIPAACGILATGFTAAMNQLAFGAPPGLGAGDACGRCFQVTATGDPYSANFTGPFNTIVVKVTDLCAVKGNEQWCGQTTSTPTNSFGQSVQCVVALWQWTCSMKFCL